MKYDRKEVRRHIEENIRPVGRGPGRDGVYVIEGSGLDHDGNPLRHPLHEPEVPQVAKEDPADTT